MTRRARGYIRESTVGQGEKFGPDAQREAIRRACVDRGLALDESRWYVDLVSGTGRVVRDELAAAISDAGRAYDVLVCYDTSRFARNERDAFAFEADMQRAGARVYYVREGIFADDQRAAVHKGVMHVINAQYSRDLAERIRDGFAAKRARGGYTGGMPWAYRYTADKMSLEPTDDLPHRLKIWERYASGRYTLSSLAEDLNAEGVQVRGRSLTRYSVYEVLTSDIDVRFGGLSRELYERAQAMLASHRLAIAKPGQRRRTYLFADLARCATCGERFIGRAFWRTGKSEPELQLKHSERGCGRGIRSENALRERFAAWLDTWRLPRDAKAHIERYIAQGAKVDPNEHRRKQLEAAAERVRRQHELGALTDQEFLDEHGRLRRELAALGPVRIMPAPSEDAMRLADHIGEAWRDVSDETRRTFLAEWFSEIRIASDGLLTVVARDAYRPLVLAAAVGTVGDVGFEPTTSRM